MPREISLSRPEKEQFYKHISPAEPSRRDFLIRSAQGLGAMLIPAAVRGFPATYAFGAADEAGPHAFHLHPHYRTPTSLDPILAKAKAENDNFPTEKYADQIASVLDRWSAGLLQSAPSIDPIAGSLSSAFSGTSFMASGEHTLRSDPFLMVTQRDFSAATKLERTAFLEQLRLSLAPFSAFHTAEFQITRIVAKNAGTKLQTCIRYELVGTGAGFHREQRVGYWEIEWDQSQQNGGFTVSGWTVLKETASRSFAPCFVDVAEQAFGSNRAFRDQLMHGADYWRSVLDAASGIDIYGHNGVAIGDIDNDGFDDVYVCQAAGLPNRLFRNRGDGTFEDITDATGVGIIENTACALFADMNNDGRQDLIVVCASGPQLFVNQGDGKFRKQPNAFKFANVPQGTFTGAAIADYDRDGWLDIYFCLYVYYQGAEQYKYPLPYYDANNGPPNFLFRNNRDGTFRDVTAESGLDFGNTRYSFCCGWNDYNGNGWPDLYVVNDFGRKNLYRNKGDGTFTDVSAEAGVQDTGAGMSVSWLDYNNDGAMDLYVANMWTAAGARISMQPEFKKSAPEEVRALYRKHAMGNSLFRNQRGGKFADETSHAEVDMGRWSWSSDAWDFDHDGFPDLYVTNGMVSGPSRDDLNSFFWRQVVAKSPENAAPAHEYEQGWSAINELIRSDGTWSGYERNVFYANNRNGTFSDISGAIGLDYLEDGRAFALADFDHDGRLEVLLKNRNSPQLRLLKNVIQSLPPSIAFRLRGTKSNRDAIGAEVTITTSAGTQVQSIQAGSGFLSQHSKELMFGLGSARGPVRASVRWPSGLVQDLGELPADHRIWVEEGAAPTRVEPFQAIKFKSSSKLPATEDVLPGIIETWLLVPVSAPEFSLPDIDGKNRTLAELGEHAGLLTLWGSQLTASVELLDAMNRSYPSWHARGIGVLTINADDPVDMEALRTTARQRGWTLPVLRSSPEVNGVYNILYRYLFDRHRDLELPTTFLINDKGEIAKVYQGPVRPEQLERDFGSLPKNPAERIARALPFHGVTDDLEFSRNYLSYGSVFYQRGYYEQALAAFEIALRDDSSSAEALYGLGSSCLQLDKAKEAQGYFERAIKSKSSYPETLPNAWNNLGLLAAREGRTNEAIDDFRRALQLSPNHVVALENLGNAYRQLKQWPEAQRVLERAVELGPQEAEANYSLAMVYAQTNDIERAHDYLTRALRIRPDYPEALNNLGILYLRSERTNDAIDQFKTCILVAPQFEQAYLNLARVYAIQNDRAAARATLQQLLARRPQSEAAQKMLSQLSQ